MTVVIGTLTAGLSGCAGLRFVIEAAPESNAFVQTEVISDEGVSSFGPRIAQIDVTGIIADAPRPALLGQGENPVAAFTEALRQAEEDNRVRAVVMRINSPGGTVTASDVMYRELVGFRERSGKPVVALMADLAASGGYYLACGADRIVAHPTTITGSIGVIMQMINVADGMRMIGIKADAIVSGPNKAAGSPLAPLSAEHRSLYQGIVNEFYDGFVQVVTMNRPDIQPSDLQWVTDGRVVTGRSALDVGLVDALGDVRDAFNAAKRLAGLDSARLVKYHRPLKHVGSAYANAPSPIGATDINLLQVSIDGDALRSGAGFYYLWDPQAW